MKIIYIEDNKLDFTVFERMFKDMPDFKITHYSYLSDFIESPQDYDVVVADLSLPDAYGPEVLKQIRKITDKPLIALSGVGGASAPPRLKKAIKAAGATHFASKNQDDLNGIKEIIINLK